MLRDKEYDETEEVSSPEDAENLTPDGLPWPTPADLLSAIQDKPPTFPMDLLPGKLRPFVKEMARIKDSPVELIAIPALCGAGALLGRGVEMKMKLVSDDWSERPSLWGVAVAPPGSLKSPTAKAALKPVIDLQKDLAAKWRLETEAAKEAGAPQIGDLPLRKTILMNDATGEKVVQAMSPDFNAEAGNLLIYRDELTGWFESMNKYRAGDDQQMFLESWSGGYYSSQGRVKGDVEVPDMFLCIYGTIQPAVAREIFGQAREDGMTPRFGMVAVLPRHAPRTLDIPMDARVKEEYWLQMMELFSVKVRKLHWAPDAWEAFQAWNDKKTAEGVKIGGPFGAYLAKCGSLLGRLCIVFHFLKHGKDAPEEVSQKTFDDVRQMIDEYFEPQIRRLHGIFETHPLRGIAQKVARWIVQKQKTRFTARDVERNAWTEFQRVDAKAYVTQVLEYLETHGWLHLADSTKGRPTVHATVNPAVLA